ncbi:MAG: hypothetical protein LQ337_003670 [Flavoplaca oasis]|nr:MAG: hypothetical protein LQ337_003670 [Flavoplaca oasis]
MTHLTSSCEDRHPLSLTSSSSGKLAASQLGNSLEQNSNHFNHQLSAGPADQSSTNIPHIVDQSSLTNCFEASSTLETSASNQVNSASAEDLPLASITSQSAPSCGQQDWVDPLLLSPLTASSQASSDTWRDPLHDWDGTLSVSEQDWADPLIENPLSSDSGFSPASSSSSPQPSPADSPHRHNPTRKRSHSNPTSPINQHYLETVPICTSNMPGESHKGKNVPAFRKRKHNDGWVKDRLEVYNMIRDNGVSLKEYPNFAAHLDGIINGKRTSGVTAEQFEDFQFNLNIYQGQNEDTMLVALLPLIIKADRIVEASRDELTEGEKTQVQSFLRSGLITIVNKEFVREFQGFREDGGKLDKELIAEMAKESGVTNPKPDRTYGINPKKYQFPAYFQISAELDHYLQIVEGLHHPCFILEGKSASGSLMDADNAACRGGTSLVRASRLLRWKLGMDTTTLGADWKTFVFSATLCPNAIFIWVHWAEVKGEDDGSNVYHMTKLKQYFLDDVQQFRATRRTLHNILDWGCGERFEGLRPLYEAIVKYDKNKKKTGAGQTEGSPTKKAKNG